MPHPITGNPWSVGASDVSAHRIISNLSAFIGQVDPSKHRVLAAGDLNLINGERRLAVARGSGAHSLGANGGAGDRVYWASDSERPAGELAAAGRAWRQEERSNVPHGAAISGGCQPTTRLRVCVPRVPQPQTLTFWEESVCGAGKLTNIDTALNRD